VFTTDNDTPRLEGPKTDSEDPARAKDRRDNALPKMLVSSTERLEANEVTP